jgi:excisionase family DNA binding protein
MTEQRNLETLIEKSVLKALENHTSKNSTKAQKEYYTRKELAELFNCSLSSIYNWTSKGKLTAYGIGNRIMYRVDEVKDALIKL